MSADSTEATEVPAITVARRPRQITCAIALLWCSLALAVGTSVAEGRYSSFSTSLWVVLPLQMLLALLTYKIGLGRNWARIFYVALLVLGSPLWPKTIAYNFGRSTTFGLLFVAELALQSAALFLALIGPGRLWFKRRV